MDNRTLRAALAGASLMFRFDPVRQPRRRELIPDNLVRVAPKTREAAGARRRDASNRM